MKKESIYPLLYAVSILLLVGFAIRLGADYFRYDTMYTSAPFYVLIIERTIEFLLPAIIVFTAATIIKKKGGKE